MLDRRLLAIPSSTVPFFGPAIAGYLIGNFSYELKEAIIYISLSLIPSLMGGVILYIFLKSFFLPIIISQPVILLASTTIVRKTNDNVSITYSEDAIEIKVIMKRKYQSNDLNQLFDKAYNSAIRKIRNPFYTSKLREIKGCSPLKVRATEQYISLRKDCGTVRIEVLVGDNTTKLKVAMPW
ncbi:hypothetical protein HS7_05870 [Sulfolobales archaeon HS-7]|nr:hypothetical protein HS7_05870 [Sulfolobales archaeon HS-7]